MAKGNRNAKGTPGNKGGGRPPLPPGDRKSKVVRMSWRLWDKIQAAAKEDQDWRVFLEALLERREQ